MEKSHVWPSSPAESKESLASNKLSTGDAHTLLHNQVLSLRGRTNLPDTALWLVGSHIHVYVPGRGVFWMSAMPSTIFPAWPVKSPISAQAIYVRDGITPGTPAAPDFRCSENQA